MNNFCPNCGTNNNASDNFCRICATPLSQNQPDPRTVRPAQTSRPTPVNKPAPTNRPAQTSRPAPVNRPAPTNRPVPVNRPVVNPDINSTQTVTPTEGINQSPVAEKTDKKQNKEKKKDKKAKKNQAVDTANLDSKQKKKLKRKKRLKKFLKAILIIFIIAAALAFTWFAVGNQITLTIHTDKEILGDALLDHKLIEGEDGDYGMYIKKVNGIQADYDKDGAYWAFSQNGEYMMTGVDGTSIAGGETYELVYTKG